MGVMFPGSVSQNAATAQPGLRARKRQHTRERLMEAGLQLFFAQGFENTTLQQIAEMVDIAPRTLFHYFAAKEDIVTAWQDRSRAALVAAIAEQPLRGGPWRVIERAIVAILRERSGDNLALARLIEATPALRAHDQMKQDDLARAVGAALHARFADQLSPMQANLFAVAVIGAIHVARRHWLADGGRRNPLSYGLKCFALLKEGLLSQAWSG